MATIYGYVRTSRRLIAGEPGNDPATQRRQLLAAGVVSSNLFQDLGISGDTGASTREGWRSLNSRLLQDDVLVVASVDRVGRGWIDVMSVIRELRDRGVRIRSLAESEQVWTRYLDADPGSPEAMIGDILATVFTWAAQQELEAIRRRTKAGMDRAREEGKHIGRPKVLDQAQLDAVLRLYRDGVSKSGIAEAMKVSRTTVRRALSSVAVGPQSTRGTR